MTVPGVRKITVPRYEIVTVSLLDTPIFNDARFADTIVEDGCDVHVLDLVVVLERPSSDFDSSNKDVLESSRVPVLFDGSKESRKVFVCLNIESSIPLAVFCLEGDLRLVAHI